VLGGHPKFIKHWEKICRVFGGHLIFINFQLLYKIVLFSENVEIFKKKKEAFLKEQFYFDFLLLFFLKEILYHCSSGMISYSKF